MWRVDCIPRSQCCVLTCRPISQLTCSVTSSCWTDSDRHQRCMQTMQACGRRQINQTVKMIRKQSTIDAACDRTAGEACADIYNLNSGHTISMHRHRHRLVLPPVPYSSCSIPVPRARAPGWKKSTNILGNQLDPSRVTILLELRILFLEVNLSFCRSLIGSFG